MNKKRYQEYLKSEKWRLKRSVALQLTENMCERCGDVSHLEIHHKTYDRLFDERIADLEVLCPSCHKKADKERKKKIALRRESRAIDTFMSKKYGEEWEYEFDDGEASEEFYSWLDRLG